MNFRAQFASEDFATLADRNSSGNLNWAAGLDYRVDVWDGVTASFGGDFARQYGAARGAVGAFVGLSFNFARLNVSVSGRYRRDADGKEQSGAFVTLSRPLGRRAFGNASYDTMERTTRTEITRPRRRETPDFGYRLGAVNTPERTDLNGSAAFATSKAELEAGVFQTFDANNKRQSEVRTARLQTGIAFADGSVGLGANPAQGFYLFDRHRSLKDADVSVYSGAGNRKLSETGPLGPAVAPAVSAYRPEDLVVRVQNAPLGYDIGPGRYVVIPGARTGTKVTVGVVDYRSALATLTFQDQPLDLYYGTFSKEGSDRSETFFTNRSGRAIFPRLSQGKYVAKIPSLGLQFGFEITSEDDALVDLGVIAMERKQ